MEQKNFFEKRDKSSSAFYIEMVFDHGDLSYPTLFSIDCKRGYAIQNYVAQEILRTAWKFRTVIFWNSIFPQFQKKFKF